jgi:hypothetical protein
MYLVATPIAVGGAKTVALGAHLLACSPDGGVREVSRLASRPPREKGHHVKLARSPQPRRDVVPLVAPLWGDVERVLDRLARAGEPIATGPTSMTSIGGYEPGRRVLLQSSNGPLWLAIESVRECWSTFERLGRIRRADVLEPGRCSAFMIALFRQVPGVLEEHEDEVYLVLPV